MMFKFPGKLLLAALVAIPLVTACTLAKDTASLTPPAKPTLVTPKATAKTQALYRNMAALSYSHLLFGHQNTTAYGVKWIDEANRSDVRDITGSYPAVFGWDIGHLEIGDSKNLDGIKFEFIQQEIINTFNRGGISTISWHMRDLVTGGSSWDKAPTVAKLIPGGEAHAKLVDALDKFIEFNNALTVTNADGSTELAPVIFRPWHEHNGDWFWWGKGPSNEADYIALWQFTIDYLRNEKGVTNLIYAFSPDRSRMDINNPMEGYMYGYPGDNYVDIIGLDNYWDLGHPYNKVGARESRDVFIKSLAAVSKIAQQKNKVAALTEGGQETVSDDGFWTDIVLDAIMADEDARRISYFLVWRNANKANENIDHFYAPYKGHKSEANFIEFYNNPITLFEDQLKDIYR